MKKYLLSFIMIICACTMFFVGCSSKGLQDNPATDATIIGNGGYAIQKGDYLYYVNGFVNDYENELDDYKKDNVEGKVVYGAIYRTKLTDNRLVKDEKGFLTNSECVVSKVVGYEQGGFYIVGDYIYYATPNMKVDSDGVIQNTRISFNRININGTKNKEIYVTEEGATDIDWRINVYDGKTYLVVVQTVTDEDEGTTSTIVKSIVDNGKKFKELTCAEGVTDVVLNNDVNLSSDYFYYTRSVKEDEKAYTTSGTLICRSSIVSGGEVVFELDKVSTFDLVELTNGRLYTTKKLTNSKTYLYSFNATENLVNQTPIRLSNDEYTTYYTMEGVPHSVIAVDSNNKMVRLTNSNGEISREVVVDSISNVVTVNEGFVYYYESNVLYRISVEGGEKQTVSGVGEAKNKTFLISSISMVDVDGRYAYVFASYTASDGTTTSYYLNRIDTMQSEMTAEFVGVFADGHMVAQPEDDGDDTTDETRWVY